MPFGSWPVLVKRGCVEVFPRIPVHERVRKTAPLLRESSSLPLVEVPVRSTSPNMILIAKSEIRTIDVQHEPENRVCQRTDACELTSPSVSNMAKGHKTSKFMDTICGHAMTQDPPSHASKALPMDHPRRRP
jgi:hypothetical protein